MHRFSKKNKIILPAITTLERIVWEARAMAEKKLFNTVSQSLTNEQKENLKILLPCSIRQNPIKRYWVG